MIQGSVCLNMDFIWPNKAYTYQPTISKEKCLSNIEKITATQTQLIFYLDI